MLLVAGSLVVYTELFGWWVAVGFMAVIYVHEMGHVVALKAKGIPATAPMFIPFFGAMIRMRGMPRNAYDEAVVGLAGPIAGTLGAVAIFFAWRATGSHLLEVIAYLGFLINLLNLIPVLPLDGVEPPPPFIRPYGPSDSLGSSGSSS